MTEVIARARPVGRSARRGHHVGQLEDVRYLLDQKMLGGAEIVIAQEGNTRDIGGSCEVLGIDQPIDDRHIDGLQIWWNRRDVGRGAGTAAASGKRRCQAGSTGGTQQLPPGDREARTYHQTVESRFSISLTGRV